MSEWRALRMLPVITLGCLVVAGAARPALAQSSGARITPDHKRTLVSKDVGDQRWAIAFNSDEGSVTGNVFSSDGGPPQFVWCNNLAPGADPLQLDCFGTNSCLAAPCLTDAWQSLGVVELPLSFFLPRRPAFAADRSIDGRNGTGTERASGVQITPDARRVLISKDVQGQRWTITLNLDDRTVTGNVFSPESDPGFLWCEQKSVVGDEVTLSCSSAAKCEGATCPPEEWSFHAEVALPASFFRPPTSGDARIGCLATSRAGDLVSASVLCGEAARRDPQDGQVALIRAVADPVARAFESASALGVIAAFGVSVRGSAFNVCEIRGVAGTVEHGSGGPTTLRGAEIQQVASQELARVTDIALARLSDVPSGQGINFALEDLPQCLGVFKAETVDVDATDLHAASSFIELIAGVAHLGNAYDADFDVGAAIGSGASFSDVFLSNPNTFVLRTAAEPELDLARTAFDRAIRNFIDAIDLARNETDDQSDDILVLSQADAEDATLAREVAQKLQTALSREARFDAEEFDLTKDQRLRLSPLFDGQLPSLRGLFPVSDSGSDLCLLPDPTFGGIARNLTQAEFNRVLRLSCDEAEKD